MELTSNINEREINLKKVDFDPFSGSTIIKTAPTTPSQIEIWLSCIIGGEDANRSYNLAISLALKGPLNQEALFKAIEIIQERHESLRSTFSIDGKSICIHSSTPLNHRFIDISHEDQQVQEVKIQELHKTDANLSFDLCKGPLFRTYLVKQSEEEHLLKICSHHIVCDGWSLGTILENLSTVYNSIVDNTKLNLAPPIKYSHYAQEIKEYSCSDEYYAAEKYWLDLYKDNIPVLNLPTDNVRPATRTFKARRQDFEVPKAVIESFKKIGIKQKTSLITTLIAAFESYLHLITNQDDITLGLPAAGQSATGNHELVGHCVNLLPLRSRFSRNDEFLNYLNRRKSEILDAYENQQFTFSSLLQSLNIARDSSRIPLVPVIFNVDMGMGDHILFAKLTHRLFSDPRAYENFEIFLNVTGTEQKLTFDWSYNSLLFSDNTIQRMMGEFQSLLEQIIQNPSIRIKNIRLARDKSLLAQLNQWNKTTVAYPRNKTTADLVNETAVKYPTKTAIYFNEQELTYTDINKQSNQLANCLIEKGIKTEDIVAVLVDRSPEMIIALLGIIKSGSAYLPLDPQYPKARIQYMLEDSKAKLIIASEKYCAGLKTETEKITIEKLWPQLSEQSTTYPSVDISGTNLAYLLYTSGTTGMPKGVQIEHHSLINYLLSFQQSPGMTSNDKLLAITTVSFDISATELYLPLISGASIRLTDSETARDGRELLSIIQEEGISYLQATPTTYQMMLSADWQSKLPIKALCGGEALTKNLAEKLLERTSELWNVYGPTETTIWSAIRKIDKPDEVTVGRPIANTQIYILDENHTILPVGSTGEICIAGDGLARGYFGRKELTVEKFIVNPIDRTKRLYKTGDLGYIRQDGEIVCLGRKDAQVKIRGHRIELEEIEYYLNKQPGVKDAIVCPYNKDGETGLLAYIIPETTKNRLVATAINNSHLINVSIEQVRNWKKRLKETLPKHMVPDYFIGISRFPTTENGKIDRKNLPVFDNKLFVSSSGDFNLPRNETEKIILEIWKKYLVLDNISVDSNFFELGGHSLTAVRVMLAIEKKFNKKLPISVLFENSTVHKLGTLLLKKPQQNQWNPLVAIRSKGSKIPLYLVHGAGLNVLTFEPLAKYMNPEQPIYALQGIGIYDNENGNDYSLEEVARRYVSEVIKNNPTGPYIIGGYSAGGILAYEMARQLISMGKDIKKLLILDSYIGDLCYKNGHQQQIFKKMMRQVSKSTFIVKSLLINPKGTINYQLKFFKSRLSKAFSKSTKNTDESLIYKSKTGKSFQEAYNKYKIEPLNVKIDLFKTKERLYFLDDGKYYGWKKYAIKGLNEHFVQGDHKTFLALPHGEEFANKLQHVIDETTYQI